MKTYYIGERIDMRTLISYGFINKTRYSKDKDIVYHDNNKVGVIISRVKKRDNPKIINIIGARCVCWFRNDVGDG